MRKRRRLANKLTIMVCAVLVAVSAFFYAPMDVDAAVNLTGSGSYASSAGRYFTVFKINMGSFKPGTGISNIDSDAFYEVKLTTSISVNSSQTINFSNVSCTFGNYFCAYIGTVESSKTASIASDRTFYLKGSQLLTNYDANLRGTIFVKNGGLDTDLSASVKFTVDSCRKVSVDAEEEYNKGYNAGYSAGEDVGYDSGYSTGYNEGYSAGQNSDSYDQGFQDGVGSVDTDSYYDSGYEAGQSDGYDTGFEAGKDSVDTESYYQAGYNAGYQAAYSLGYEEGYDEAYDIAFESGYNSAMDRIENWGADTTDYPLRLSSGSDNGYFSVHVGSDIPFNYRDSQAWHNSNDYNPNHTYKYVINFSNIDVGLNSDILYDFWCLYLNIGGIEYHISPMNNLSHTVFIPGDRMSTSYSFDWVLYNCANFVSGDSNLAYMYVDYDFVIYDMGPSGDTQNHIANQTDQLTNGYDDSKGNEVNSELSTGLNEYQTAEDSLWATATTGLKDFTFFDFESVPAMITGMSFITSIMGKWFNEAGGASGVGIVLSILFSVMLVSMVLGLYRLYQSASRRAEFRQIHKESMERWKKGK